MTLVPSAELTFEDLRRRFGPSQAAFAERTGLTQAQVSDLEHGKIRPHQETIARIAVGCGVSEEQVTWALARTQLLLSHADLALTYRFQRAIADLYPRESEGERLDLSARLIGLGERIVRAVHGGERIHWLAVSQTAYDAYRSTDAQDWRHDAGRAVSRGAFVALKELCGSAAVILPQVIETDDWSRSAKLLVQAATGNDEQRTTLHLIRVFSTVLAVTTDEARFVPAYWSYRKQADALLLRPARGEGDLTPVQAQLFAAGDLLKGIREGLRQDA